jgi:hypothetical protein
LYRTFDFLDPTITIPRRYQTTVAPPALFLMNHPFVIDAARGILTRSEDATEHNIDARIERLYRLIYCRPPTEVDLALAREFLGGLNVRNAITVAAHLIDS